jgi:hypothetical protein
VIRLRAPGALASGIRGRAFLSHPPTSMWLCRLVSQYSRPKRSTQVARCILRYSSALSPNELAAASTGSSMCGGTKI